MLAPVLNVQGLDVYRGQKLVVQDVSFSLLPSTNTALVGPNGAGKSTLVQALLGILPRQAGEVSILDHQLSRRGKLNRTIRQNIAYLPQTSAFDENIPITVEELVGLGWDDLVVGLPWVGWRDRRRAIEIALHQVGAWHLRKQLLSSLSGGETKRTLLAYCLVRPRRLVILDEAPAGLDSRGETEFYQLLDYCKQEQQWAILQISHDLDMVRKTCDRVICFNRTIHCQGKPDQTLSQENLALIYGNDFVAYHHHCKEA
ncbi:MAG: metal ABC transporter ATP-binding protein [Synechococcaceae cyanobacterium RL_1_2]|nr:metal ABC transporter ATP-binding protein [Synechococcaceae cyanobacterium RL_1_2]